MKRKMALIFLSLVLVLGGLMPATVAAAKPQFVDFNASGFLFNITPGNVAPAGDSGRWRVIEREIDFYLFGPSITGPSALIYKANVELATQAGNLYGTMTNGSYIFEVNGEAAPLVIDYSTMQATSTSSGHWTLLNGQGNGSFTATVLFQLGPDGHIVSVVGGSLGMTGKWQP